MDVAVFVLVLVIAFPVLKWLGLVIFRAKTLSVLKVDFDYTPAVPGAQAQSFNATTRYVKSQAWNEYDAAIIFMYTQLEALSKPLTSEAREFYDEKVKIINEVMDKSKAGLLLQREFLKIEDNQN